MRQCSNISNNKILVIMLMTPIANLSQIEKKTHMFFLVVITNATLQPSRLRFSTFVSPCFFVVALADIHSSFSRRLSYVCDARTLAQ